MKGNYEKPKLEMMKIDEADIITTSTFIGGLIITDEDEPEQKWKDWF